MKLERTLGLFAAGAVALTGRVASADYYSHPEIRPENRCIVSRLADPGTGWPAVGEYDASKDTDHDNKVSFVEGGVAADHCQKLIWDLPVTTELGVVSAEASRLSESVPRFPNGRSDRIPPLFVGTLGNGVREGFEREADCNANAGDCERLCPDPEDVGYWKPVLEADGKTQKVGTDAEGQTGKLVETACQRGSRAYFGPWQVGTDPNEYDGETGNNMIKFENTSRLDADQGRGVVDRLEWNIASEFYNHFASHHGTCYQPDAGTCGDPTDPKPREAYNTPDGECATYEAAAEPTSRCYSADEDPGCSGGVGTTGFRNATQLPGRLSVPVPDGRGVLGTEDQYWGCNHHVVHQLPPGSYGMTRLADYREQKGGVVNRRDRDINGAAPGEVIGGSVGEMIIQYLTEPTDNLSVRPVSVMFNAIADAATTFYPPFTWNYHEAQWFAPYDAEVALGAIHSHHRMVKGTMNPAGGYPPRLNSPDPLCGGAAGVASGGEAPTDLYVDWWWEDAPVCEWWSEPDGTVPLRKGQSWRTTCWINNGVTPEAVKHGLVAGAAVEALKALGAPIPDYPETVAASTWGDALAGSPIGTQLLYGTHPPVNYRVKYTCGPAPGIASTAPPIFPGQNCQPNPAVDADGDYIDGPYESAQCGGDYCSPSSIVFACIGEEEMCIGVSMYWGMERPLNSDGSVNEGWVAAASAGDVNSTGTPINTGSPSDATPVAPAGNCPDCKPGL